VVSLEAGRLPIAGVRRVFSYILFSGRMSDDLKGLVLFQGKGFSKNIGTRPDSIGDETDERSEIALAVHLYPERGACQRLQQL
jgi:hypothetical protein